MSGVGVGFSGALSRVMEANVRLTARATELASRALETAFGAAEELGARVVEVRAAAEPVVKAAAQEEAKAAAILLEGVAGSTAVGFFVVENSLPRAVSAAVEVSSLSAADGRTVASALKFSPGTIALEPGEQVVARVAAKISRRLVIGVRYEGLIRVPGMEGAQIPIVMRRREADVAVGQEVKVKAAARRKAK